MQKSHTKAHPRPPLTVYSITQPKLHLLGITVLASYSEFHNQIYVKLSKYIQDHLNFKNQGQLNDSVS